MRTPEAAASGGPVRLTARARARARPGMREPPPNGSGGGSRVRPRKGAGQPLKGLTAMTLTVAFLPFGSSYWASSPTFLPSTPAPSGDCGE